MEILVAYDVATSTDDGARRLRRVAAVCCGFGQRVQKSVFECSLTEAQYEEMKSRLLACVDLEHDNLRFYRLPSPKADHVEHLGAGEPLDLDAPLIV